MDNDRSIEFQDVKKDAQQLDIVRKSFRVPVVYQDDIQVILDDKEYAVADISIEGVGIICKDRTMLTVSKTYHNCRLKTPDGVIGNLTGKVIHFSSDSDKDWRHGVQWIGLEKAAGKKIAMIVGELKSKLLKPQDAGNG